MTLDEQIAWLEEEAQESIAMAADFVRGAGLYRDMNNAEWTRSCEEGEAEARERAATLLTIENTLRAMREDVGAELQRRADDILLGRAQAFAERFNAQR